MRKLWAAGIAVALALWLVPPAGVSGAAAAESDHARLERYAATTWASFVAMVDTPSGLPTDQLHADGSTDVQTSTTNIGAYLWSAVAAERLGIIGARRAGRPARRRPSPRSRGWSATQPDGQFYNWYDHRDGVEAHALAADRRAAGPDPVLGRQRLARDRPADRRATPYRSCPRGASALYDSMDFGFYYVPGEEPDPVPLLAREGHRPVLLRHGRLREPDRRLHRDRQGRAAAQGVLRPLADVPRHLRLLLPGDAARAASPARYDGVERLRRQLPLRRHAARRRAGAARCSRR